jgi:hypothetical protein
LNKKSAQKQKRICNNRFSQAVVLYLGQTSSGFAPSFKLLLFIENKELTMPA